MIENKIFGMMRVRNEEEIIEDAISHLSEFCNGGIIIYDDCSEDNTYEICKNNRSVLYIIKGKNWDRDRAKAEFENRQLLLEKTQEYAKHDDWLIYIDADERIDYDWKKIEYSGDGPTAIKMKLFDFYITEEDKDLHYSKRVWLGPEFREIIIAFKNNKFLKYEHPDQREVTLAPNSIIIHEGFVKHYGKSLSVEAWEKKCEYYSKNFPMYSAKWEARKGKAIHSNKLSDFNLPLITWNEKTEKGILLTPEIESRQTKYSLNILITNHHLDGYTGSEIFTLTLAKSLKNRGHNITVYSKYITDIGHEFRNSGINLVENLNEIKNNHFDVAHIHHNISLIEVRNVFPYLAVVFLSQGVLPFLEHPPFFDLNVSRYIAISDEIKEELVKGGIPEKDIDIIGNLIDVQKFSNTYQIKNVPQKALVISGRIDSQKEQVIKEACKVLNIEIEFIGGRFGVVSQDYLSSKIESTDIIFSLGRGAIEGMIAGKCVIIYDYLGGDGIVNSNTFNEIKKNNFSGRRFKIDFDVNTLIDEIKKYDKKEIEIVKSLAIEEYSSELAALKLERIYRDIINNSSNKESIENFNLVKFINSVIEETFNYAMSKGKNNSKVTNNTIRNNEYSDEKIINELNEYLATIEQNNSHSLRKETIEKALKELKNIPEQEKLLLINNCEKLIKEKAYFHALVLLENNRALLSDDLKAQELERNIYDEVKISNQKQKWNSNVCNIKMKKAEKYFNENQIEKAESVLLEILNSELFNLEAVNNLSIASLALEKESRALELVKYVLNIDPENETAKETDRFIKNNNISSGNKINNLD